VRQKFTGYEKDAETGLDYAQARMFSGAQGRFTSIDPLMASGRAWNPQSWNRYTYTLNRPLSLIDPTGLADDEPDLTEEQNRRQQQQGQNARVNIRRVDNTYNVSGQTAREALANAPQQAAANGIPQGSCENGCIGLTRTAAPFTYDIDPTNISTTRNGSQASASISNFVISATITVTLPTWDGYSSASQAEQKVWDDAIAGLKDHEEGHVVIATATLQAAAQAVDALPTFTARGSTPQAAFDRAQEITKQRVNIAVGVANLNGAGRQHNYDTITKHGIIPRSEVPY
jgi:RHS repeat-associated protein